MKRIDLTGKRFVRLLVIGYDSTRRSVAYWRCRCDCGTETVVSSGNLAAHKQISCGCYQNQNRIKHGMSYSTTYQSWHHMLTRCSDLADANYGGRGIVVCDRWKVFADFLADMGERPKGRTLDRIDNDGNYEPGNCRWATRAEQTANRRITHLAADRRAAILRALAAGTPPRQVAREAGVTPEYVYQIRKAA